WTLYFFCAMLIGISKTGIQNIGSLTVPLFALLFGAKFSTGIVLILLCFADLVAVIYYRKAFLWNEVRKLLPLALIGLLSGLLLGNFIDDSTFITCMGMCLLLGVGIMIFVERSNIELQKALASRKWYAPIFGFVLGFSTMI